MAFVAHAPKLVAAASAAAPSRGAATAAGARAALPAFATVDPWAMSGDSPATSQLLRARPLLRARADTPPPTSSVLLHAPPTRALLTRAPRRTPTP